MRKTLLVLALAAAVVWMFQHPEELQEHSAQLFRSASKFFGQLAGENTSGTAETSAPAWIAELPEDVYCLLQPVRVSSGGSSSLLSVGAMVQKTGEGSGKMVITDGTGTAVVEVGMLTRDPAVINQLMQKLTAGMQARGSAERSNIQHRVQEIDAKLSSLREELHVIRMRDYAAAKGRRRVTFETTESFVQSNITMLEKMRTELLKQLPPPPPPAN